MAIEVKKQVAVPDGKNTGTITACRETTKNFGKGPEPVVEVIIAPDHRGPNGETTFDLNVVFSPVLNGESALSKLLERLECHPADGQKWQPSSLVGERVSFVVSRKKEDGSDARFAHVYKDSICLHHAEA